MPNRAPFCSSYDHESPVEFAVQAPANSEREPPSMNICNHGVISPRSEVHEGVMIQVHLEMPGNIGTTYECAFTAASRMSNR